jgi:hypothetical protein
MATTLPSCCAGSGTAKLASKNGVWRPSKAAILEWAPARMGEAE